MQLTIDHIQGNIDEVMMTFQAEMFDIHAKQHKDNIDGNVHMDRPGAKACSPACEVCAK